MRKYLSREPYNPKTKELWDALKSEYQWFDLLKGNGKNHESLTELIRGNDKKDPKTMPHRQR